MILAGLDVGNNNIKVITEQGRSHFMHVLHMVRNDQLRMLEEHGSGVEDPYESLYCVNGVYYAVGEVAIRMGAPTPRYGEARYTRDYYGILGAIALFQALVKDTKRVAVCVFATYTPKDVIYTANLKNSIRGDWKVSHKGQTLTIHVQRVETMDEPTGHYRHAILYDGGLSPVQHTAALRQGSCLTIDFGGFTTGFTVADNGKVDYSSAQSLLHGVQGVIDQLAVEIRAQYREKLFGTQTLDPAKLREALMTEYYKAGGKGALDCRELVNEALNPLLYEVMNMYGLYGGAASHDSILIAGAGGWLVRDKITPRLDHSTVLTSDRSSEGMLYGAAYGAYKTAQALKSRGKL